MQARLLAARELEDYADSLAASGGHPRDCRNALIFPPIRACQYGNIHCF
jgi:hypothetical protein